MPRTVAALAFALLLVPVALAQDFGDYGRVYRGYGTEIAGTTGDAKDPVGCTAMGWKILSPQMQMSDADRKEPQRFGKLFGTPVKDANGYLVEVPQRLEGTVVDGHLTSDDAHRDIAWLGLTKIHNNLDANFFVMPDQPYMRLLANPGNFDTGEGRNVGVENDRIEVEWERAAASPGRPVGGFPEFAWPTSGDHVQVEGTWAIDCGHGGTWDDLPIPIPRTNLPFFKRPTGLRSEIHPPAFVATQRHGTVAHAFDSTNGEPVASTRVDLYASNFGGAAVDKEGIGKDGIHDLRDRSFSFVVRAPGIYRRNLSVALDITHEPTPGEVAPTLSSNITEEQDGYTVTVTFPSGGATADHPFGPLATLGASIFVAWGGNATVAPRLTRSDLAGYDVVLDRLDVHQTLCGLFTVGCEWSVYAYVNGEGRYLFPRCDERDAIGECLTKVANGDRIDLAQRFHVDLGALDDLHIMVRGVRNGEPFNDELGAAEVWLHRSDLERRADTELNGPLLDHRLRLASGDHVRAGRALEDAGCRAAREGSCYTVWYHIERADPPIPTLRTSVALGQGVSFGERPNATVTCQDPACGFARFQWSPIDIIDVPFVNGTATSVSPPQQPTWWDQVRVKLYTRDKLQQILVPSPGGRQEDLVQFFVVQDENSTIRLDSNDWRVGKPITATASTRLAGIDRVKLDAGRSATTTVDGSSASLTFAPYDGFDLVTATFFNRTQDGSYAAVHQVLFPMPMKSEYNVTASDRLVPAGSDINITARTDDPLVHAVVFRIQNGSDAIEEHRVNVSNGAPAVLRIHIGSEGFRTVHAAFLAPFVDDPTQETTAGSAAVSILARPDLTLILPAEVGALRPDDAPPPVVHYAARAVEYVGEDPRDAVISCDPPSGQPAAGSVTCEAFGAGGGSERASFPIDTYFGSAATRIERSWLSWTTVIDHPTVLAANEGMFFVASAGEDSIQVFGPDGASGFAFPAGGAVRALAIDPVANDLYALTSNALVRFDATNATAERAWPLGSPVGLAVDAARGRVYATDAFAGRILEVARDDAQDPRLISVGGAPAEIAVDPASGRILVSDLVSDSLRAFDPASDAPTAVATAHAPAVLALAFDEKGHALAASADGTLARLDAATLATQQSLRVGALPLGIAIVPARGLALVTSADADALYAIDISSMAIVGGASRAPPTLSGGGPAAIGSDPYGVAYDGGTVYVANSRIFDNVERTGPYEDDTVATLQLDAILKLPAPTVPSVASIVPSPTATPGGIANGATVTTSAPVPGLGLLSILACAALAARAWRR